MDGDQGRDIIIEEVPYELYNTVAAQIEDELDDRHLDDTQYEDEFELQYVEWILAVMWTPTLYQVHYVSALLSGNDHACTIHELLMTLSMSM